MSLNTSIPSAMERRLRVLDQDNVKRLLEESASNGGTVDRKLLDAIGVEVRTYKNDPMINVITFAENIFVEQYHFGRPDIVPYGGCIGEYVPVLQYRRDSNGYQFFSAHFDYLWSQSRDRTLEIVSKALQFYGERTGVT